MNIFLLTCLLYSANDRNKALGGKVEELLDNFGFEVVDLVPGGHSNAHKIPVHPHTGHRLGQGHINDHRKFGLIGVVHFKFLFQCHANLELHQYKIILL